MTIAIAFASASVHACNSDAADLKNPSAGAGGGGGRAGSGGELLDAGEAADRGGRAALPDCCASDSTGDSSNPVDGPGDPNEDAAVDRQIGEVSLWNGRDLSEWDGDPKIWRVENAAIVASAASGTVKTNSFLIYKARTFSDFVVTGEVWLGASGNSGIQYRSWVSDPALWRVGGYQFDLGSGYWGMLFEEQSRGTLVPSSSACLEAGRFDVWHTFEISVQGTSFLHRLNGNDCMSFTESVARSRDGVIALQYHVPGGFEVRFRNLRLRELTDQ